MKARKPSCQNCAKFGFSACPYADEEKDGCEAFEDRMHWIAAQIASLERSRKRLTAGTIAAVLVLAAFLGVSLALHIHMHQIVTEHVQRHAGV